MSLKECDAVGDLQYNKIIIASLRCDHYDVALKTMCYVHLILCSGYFDYYMWNDMNTLYSGY